MTKPFTARRKSADTGPAGSPASQARQAARLSVEQAARLARVCPAYLRRVERRGGASYPLARRLSRLYGCPISCFLYPDLGGGTLKSQPRVGAATGAGPVHPRNGDDVRQER